jgi:hypothetical protein
MRTTSDALPPPLLDHAIDALLSQRVGGAARFMCPIADVVMLNALGFGPTKWHPFSATLRQLPIPDRFDDSILARFYSLWQPRSGAEAVAGFREAPAALSAAPAYGYHFTPWSHLPLSAVLKEIRAYHLADYAEHGCNRLTIEIDGFKYHGPVSTSLGNCEYQRLRRIHQVLMTQGYDRRYGDVSVYILRRGAETRLVCRGGVHRIAALTALGHQFVPARLVSPYLVDISERAWWPQVSNETWSLKAATRYFDHLFEFDAAKWAIQLDMENTHAY